MKDPVSAITDGLTVAAMEGVLLIGILVLAAVGQFFLHSIFRRIFGNQFTAGEYFSLSLGGWLLPASLISYVWYVSATLVSLQSAVPITGTAVVLAGVILFLRRPKGTAEAARPILPALVLTTGLFIVLRLAYVSRAVLPMYFDSAQHYRYIAEMLSGLQESSPGVSSLVSYYHLGFHFLAAFTAFTTRAEITDTMLILGQVILAVMSLPLFFLVRHVTRSNSAGSFAVALAAFGWYMPAHAVDWGKYPALAGLSMLPFILSLTYLWRRYKNSLSRPYLWTLNAVLLGSIVVSVFLHSRTLVLLAILALTWALQSVWQGLSGRPRLSIVCAAILVVLTEIIFIQRQGLLGPLFDPYGLKAAAISLSVFLLSIIAYPAYPGLVFSCLVSGILLLASLFIPVTNVIPGFANTTLLDRPFVEMVLYLPLALLGGFGLAGLEQKLENIKWVWGKNEFAPGKFAGVFFILLVVVNAWIKYDLYPSDCCDIVSEDDLAAIQWLAENLPEDAHILVASTDLRVLPTDEPQGSAGGDAGTWITPLIHRRSTFMPYDTDFSQRQILEDLCRMQVDYVYAGGTGWGFDTSGLGVHPDGYQLVFEKPKASVFQVTGCNDRPSDN